MIIKMTELSYSFGGDGSVTAANVQYATFESGQNFNVKTTIKAADLPDGKTFDDMTRNQFDALARTTIIGWIQEQEATTTAAQNATEPVEGEVTANPSDGVAEGVTNNEPDVSNTGA